MKRDIDKYNQARKMRQAGESIRTITRTLKISSSSASIWCRDVKLSQEQKDKLAEKGKSTELLQKFASKRHEIKIQNSLKILNNSKKEIKKLNNNELFLTGLALYWAEGFKNQQEQRVGFCNSDPRMIKFMMKWFREALKISDESFTLRAEFNQIHEGREAEIENYWSTLTNIPRSQFNKSYLQKAKWNRDYSNKGKYYGLLRIRIRKSSQLLVKLRGWIEGLALNGILSVVDIYPKETWISPKLEVKESKIGKGMFTKEPIKEGETVIIWGGDYIDTKGAEKAKKDGKLVMQWDDNVWTVENRGEDDTYFINHSCDPNLWMKDTSTLIARRNINEGEELTADYALWEADENYISKWECHCDSPLCRHKITGKDWRLPELQQRYKGYFSELINKRINNYKQSNDF